MEDASVGAGRDLQHTSRTMVVVAELNRRFFFDSAKSRSIGACYGRAREYNMISDRKPAFYCPLCQANLLISPNTRGEARNWSQQDWLEHHMQEHQQAGAVTVEATREQKEQYRRQLREEENCYTTEEIIEELEGEAALSKLAFVAISYSDGRAVLIPSDLPDCMEALEEVDGDYSIVGFIWIDDSGQYHNRIHDRWRWRGSEETGITIDDSESEDIIQNAVDVLDIIQLRLMRAGGKGGKVLHLGPGGVQ